MSRTTETTENIAKKPFNKALIIVPSILAVIILLIVIAKVTDQKDYSKKYEGIDLSLDVEGTGKEDCYTR